LGECAAASPRLRRLSSRALATSRQFLRNRIQFMISRAESPSWSYGYRPICHTNSQATLVVRRNISPCHSAAPHCTCCVDLDDAPAGCDLHLAWLNVAGVCSSMHSQGTADNVLVFDNLEDYIAATRSFEAGGVSARVGQKSSTNVISLAANFQEDEK
jgi:hypothetical protein